MRSTTGATPASCCTSARSRRRAVADPARTLHDLFGREFLERRPLLDAIECSDPVAPVLLIDEIDRADDEFEAFLLELLSDFQVTIPEIGHDPRPRAGRG